MKIYCLLFIIASFNLMAIEPDISLIRKWDKVFYDSHRLQPFPKTIRFVANNKNKNKKVTYVATKHKSWKITQKKIAAAISTIRPDIILIEGVGKTEGISPRKWDIEIKQSMEGEGFEDYFAYKLALENKIPFTGTELDGYMREHTSYERDIAVVNRIAELLDTYENILIIYGAGHYVQQELALEKMLGRPIEIK